MRPRYPVALALGFTLCLASHAEASPYYGYEMKLDGSGPWQYNAPLISLTNIGVAHISRFELTIGDLDYNFDLVYGSNSPGFSHTLITPDTINGGVRSDVLIIDFAGFAQGLTWSGYVDIDANNARNGTGTIEDAREVLWNNDAGTPAVITVTFADGFQLAGVLPDDFRQQAMNLQRVGQSDIETRYAVDGDLYQFAQTTPDSRVRIIPTPTAGLLGLALLALTTTRRQR
jgi:hypothetical protein